MGLSFLVLGVIPGAIDFKKLAEAGLVYLFLKIIREVMVFF